MNTFRRFSRRAWLLHGYLLASMILWPVPTVRSYWTWDTTTNAKVQVPDPPLTVEVIDSETGISNTIPNPWWELDGDGDGLTNAEEASFGSDPTNFDSDYDGVSDKDERDLTPGMHGDLYSSDPWNWDSNGDGYSDHDTYWAWISGTTNVVHYYSLSPPHPLPTTYYYDADSDGYRNHQDAYPLDGTQWEFPDPTDNDADDDGHDDDQDSHPDDSTQWDNWPVDNDSDDDGHDDDQDSHPNDNTQWDNWPPDTDADDDGHDDDQDSHPYDANQWDNWPVDTDGDGWSNDNDTDPDDVALWFDADRNGYNDDDSGNEDMDTVPNGTDSHPLDNSLWDDRNNNGTNDFDEDPPDDDADDDGVSDGDEALHETDPQNPDSDGDGLLDGEERTATTSPLNVDSDADGLTDYEEIMVYHTNPTASRSVAGQVPEDYYHVSRTDTDLDGLPDLIETHYGLSPSNPADAQQDRDNDGFTNMQAYNFGWHLGRGFRSYDYDADGITDAREAYWDAMYPGYFDMSDRANATADPDQDGLLNIEEIRHGFDPMNPATNGLPELDCVNNWNFGWTICRNPGDLTTDADNDTDGDGMSDAWEHLHRFDLRDARDAIADPDRDGLSNLTEFRFQTHPRIPKSNRTTHDRTRLYATGKPLNASTASGLMTRYRAHIEADLTFAPTRSKFLSHDVTPSSGISPLPTSIEFKKRENGQEWPTSWSAGNSASVASWRTEPRTVQVGVDRDCTCADGPIDSTTTKKCCLQQGTCAGGGTSSSSCGCQYSVAGTRYEPGTSGGSSVRFRVSVRFSSPKSRAKTFIVTANGNFLDGFNLFPDLGGPDQVVVTNVYHAPMIYDADGNASGSAIIEIQEKPVDDDAPDSPPVTFSTYDSAGSRYRKVALNGLPLPDQKPQGQDESGERDEETYVDAYTRQLSHSVTDIYAQDPSTLLPLCVRRDVTGETWNIRNGLQVGERNDLPFGPCWRSNISSYVRFECNSDKPICTATVVDEQGGTTRFISGGLGTQWEHTGEEFTNAKSAASILVGTAVPGADVTFTKKFGTICHYEVVIPRVPGLSGYAIDQDRISGSDDLTYYVFARLTWVQDRHGNRLKYQYPDSDTLTPSKIYDPDRSGRQITFQNDLDGRVVAARGPSGETVFYEYQGQNGGLSKVIRGGENVRYGYQEFMERDENFYRWGGSENLFYHQNLNAITDELGRNFFFDYLVDHDVTYDTFSAGEVERRIQLGMPRRVVSIHGPGGLVSFTGSRKIHAGWPDQGGWPSGGSAADLSSMIDAKDASTTVSGPAGTVAYGFYSPTIKMPNLQGLTMERIANPLSFNFGVFYTSMMIKKFPLTAANDPFASTSPLSETYYFNPDISGALTAAIDASGNTTSFAYDGTYDDPVSETRLLADGTKVEKKFTYDPLTRVMTSMTDPMGVRTEYTLDHSHTKATNSGLLPVLGLKTAEKVFDASNNLLRDTRFSYDHPVFAGMVTKQWTISSDETVMPSSVVETTLAPTTDSLGVNPGWWCEVTQKSGPATSIQQSGTTVSTGGLASVMTSSTTVHDLSGRKCTVIDPRGLMTNFTYDGSGRLSRIDHSGGAYKTLGYDLHGNLTAEKNENGTTTFHDYDDLNRRVKTTVDLNNNGVPDAAYTIAGTTPGTVNNPPAYNGDLVTTTTYNVFNLPVDVIDARGTLTSHGYDGLGRLTSKTVGGLVTSYFYDGLNNGGSLFDVSGFKPNRTIDPMGTQTTVLYDKLYRPVSSSVLYKSGRLKNPPPSVPVAQAAKDAAETARHAARDVWEEAVAAEILPARKNMSPAELQDVLDDFQSEIDDAYAAYSALPQPGDIGALEAAYQAADLAYQQALQDQTDYGVSTSTNGGYDSVEGARLATAVATANSVLSTASQAIGEANLRASGLEAAMLQIQDMESERDAVADLMPIVEEAVTNSALKTALNADDQAAKAAVAAAAAVLAAAERTLNEANHTLSEAQAVAAGTYIPDLYLSAVSLTEYDLNGKPVQVTDPLGRVTLNEYDDLGNLIKVTEPDLTTDTSDNPTVRSYYTHHGKPWKVIDQMGNETTTRYDALGRPLEAKGPPLTVSSSPSLQVSAVTTTEYDAAGNAIAVTDPLGRVVETVYDERNRPTHVYAPTMWDAVSGQFVRPYAVTTYDALGQPTSVTDHTGATTTSHYDRAGRKWKVEAPSLPVSSSPNLTIRPTTLTSFDPGGLPVTVTNPLGQTITNTYDVHGRLKTTLDAEDILNEFDYDAAGNRTLVKDGLNQQTTFKYDGLNRLIEQRFADGDTWTHTYNAVQKESQLSPRGIVTSYGYDARDRLLTVTASGTEGGIAFPPTSRSYTYDNAGKLKTVTESGTGLQPVSPPSALAVSYTYDEMGRVTAECSNNQTHQYEYDLVGNRVKASYSTGRVVETSYDGLNRPEAIVDGDRLTRYGYDKAGRAVILVAANGQTSSNTYDALGRLTDRVLYKTPAMDPAQRLAQFKWQHDLLGNVTQQEEIWPGEPGRAAGVRSTTMGYDDNNRLTSETISHPTEGTQSTTYTYDDANNRDTKTITGGTEPGHWDYSYNAANQLTAWEHLDYPGGSVLRSASLTYDDAGNRTSQAVTQVSGTYNPTYNPQPAVSGLTTYTWDAQDRLASVTLPDGSEHRYAYDYRTRRLSTGVRTPSSANETKTSIVFSGGLSVAEWEQESGTGFQPVLSAPPTIEYTRGPDMGGGVGGLLYSSRSESASASVSSSRTLRYNLSNGRGDIVAQSDSYASLTWTASYEAYGKRTKETGENKDKQRGNSKDEDPTGLLNEGFRYRDIETGVWLSRDPAGFVDGPNVYAYVKQNPWTGWDPDGLETKKEAIKKRDALDKNKKSVIDGYNKSNMSKEEKEKAIKTVEEEYEADRQEINERITKIEKTAKDMAKIFGHDQAYHEEHLDDNNPQDKELIDMLEHAEAYGFREGIVNTMAGDFKDAGVQFVKNVAMKRLLKGFQDKFGFAKNPIDYQNYKDSLRKMMSKPDVTNPDLKGLMDELYRPGAAIGSGSTAAAVRHEMATGQQVGGRTHTEKAQNYIKALGKWLKNNTDASGGDKSAAENVMQDMINALNGK